MNEIFRSVIAMTALLLSIAASGERRIHIIESPNLHCNDTVVVYSPEASANHRDCHALFLLHGWGGNQNHMSGRFQGQLVVREIDLFTDIRSEFRRDIKEEAD